MIRLQGTITARTPISVSYPGMDGRLPRSIDGEIMLHGGTLRGALRKAAYKTIRERLAEVRGVAESEVFSLADAYMLGEGVDTTREVENESRKGADPVAEHWLRCTNPMLDLFGRWRLPGRLSVADLCTPQGSLMTAGRGARRDMFEANFYEASVLSDDDRDLLIASLESEKQSQTEIDALDGQIEALKAQKKDASKDQKEKIQAQIKDAREKQKQLKQNRLGAEESIKHPIAGFEAVAPGAEFDSLITLISGTQADLGLLLMALAELSRTPYLGGHRNVGCGLFEAHWEVIDYPIGCLEAETVGEVSITGKGFVMSEVPRAAYDAFAAKLTDYDFTIRTLTQARAAAQPRGGK